MQYQTVIVTLSNGTTGSFTGPAIVNPNNKDLRISRIVFTEPQELPKGMKFELIDRNDEKGAD
jgi:hypothetical protein